MIINDLMMKFMFFIVTFTSTLAAISSTASATLQCYSGSVGGSGHSINNFTCNHISTHQLPVLNKDNITYTNVTYSLHSDDSDNYTDVKHCMIFKFGQDDKADYHCDFDSVCSEYDSTTTESWNKIGINLKGNRGTLFCCTQDFCNSRAIGGTLPATPNSLQCYEGNATKHSSRTCTGSHWCITSTVIRAVEGVNIKPYSCDTQHLCDTGSLQDGCVMVNDTLGTQRKVCCCSSDLCNDVGLQPTTTQSTHTVPVKPLSTMPPHLPPQQSKSFKHWMFVGGIVAGVMFGTLMFIVVAIAIKRYKQQRDTLLTYSYTQLTADLADDRETDDERMLVG